MLLVAGSRLDSYEIIAPLGSGGMGEVYHARDTSLKRDVAIKVVREYWSRSDLVSSSTTTAIVNWTHSPDYKYVYYTTGGAEPMASAFGSPITR